MGTSWILFYIILCISIFGITHRDNLTEFTSGVSSPSEHAQSQKQTAASYARVLFETLERIVSNGHAESRLAIIKAVPHLLNMLLIQNRYIYYSAHILS